MQEDITDLVKSKFDILYHWTPSYCVEGIQYNGLIPSHKNEVFNYPPRTHLMEGNSSDEQMWNLGQQLCIKNNKTMKIQESKLKKIVKETIHQVLDETSRRQKAQQSIMGKNRRVKTMSIISAYNPMGGDGTNLPEHYNKQAHEELINNLRVGQFKYFEVIGKYKTFEKSVIVYNISLDDTLFLCYKYNQESVVFIDLTDDNEISYQYWEGDDHNSRLKKQREEHEITNAANDTDAYTQISKKFKFRIPFFESIQNYINELDERSKIYDVDKLISECLEDGWSGKHKYICRGKLHGKLPNL